MKRSTALVLCLVLGWLSGCTNMPPSCYPISGQPCAASDPVHDLRPEIFPQV